MVLRPKYTFQKRYTEGQQAYENIFKIIIREMQIKTTMRYHHTLARMAIIKKVYKQNMLGRVWKKGNDPMMLLGM